MAITLDTKVSLPDEEAYKVRKEKILSVFELLAGRAVTYEEFLKIGWASDDGAIPISEVELKNALERMEQEGYTIIKSS